MCFTKTPNYKHSTFFSGTYEDGKRYQDFHDADIILAEWMDEIEDNADKMGDGHYLTSMNCLQHFHKGIQFVKKNCEELIKIRIEFLAWEKGLKPQMDMNIIDSEPWSKMKKAVSFLPSVLGRPLNKKEWNFLINDVYIGYLKETNRHISRMFEFREFTRQHHPNDWWEWNWGATINMDSIDNTMELALNEDRTFIKRAGFQVSYDNYTEEGWSDDEE